MNAQQPTIPIPHPPCLDCPDRHIGCHAKCEPYLTYKHAVDERRKRINMEKMADGVHIDHIARVKNKLRKRYG